MECITFVDLSGISPEFIGGLISSLSYQFGDKEAEVALKLSAIDRQLMGCTFHGFD
jgi:hypothetical protein